jgi:hypothetical protein
MTDESSNDQEISQCPKKLIVKDGANLMPGHQYLGSTGTPSEN